MAKSIGGAWTKEYGFRKDSEAYRDLDCMCKDEKGYASSFGMCDFENQGKLEKQMNAFVLFEPDWCLPST